MAVNLVLFSSITVSITGLAAAPQLFWPEAVPKLEISEMLEVLLVKEDM